MPLVSLFRGNEHTYSTHWFLNVILTFKEPGFGGEIAYSSDRKPVSLAIRQYRTLRNFTIVSKLYISGTKYLNEKYNQLSHLPISRVT